jgi:hypothetical protein
MVSVSHTVYIAMIHVHQWIYCYDTHDVCQCLYSIIILREVTYCNGTYGKRSSVQWDASIAEMNLTESETDSRLL